MNLKRRDFLKVGLLTASAMSFAACGRPVEHDLVSQYHMPEYKSLGRPSFWATTCTELRGDCSVSVKTVENRAIQVVPMPNHFFSKGGVTAAAVSALNALYHPARLSQLKGLEDNAAKGVSDMLKASGANTLFVVERLCGSTGDVIVQTAKSLGAKIWICDSQQSMEQRRILKAVTGRAELPHYDLENRDFVVSVGCNFFQDNFAPTRTEWAYGRFRQTPGKVRGRMVTYSSRMNATDAVADLWFPVAPGAEPYVLGALGKLLSDKGRGAFPAWAAVTPEEAAEQCGMPENERGKFVENLKKLADRLSEAEAPLVIGGFQGPNGDATVFLAHTITKMLTGDVPTFEPDTLIGTETSGAGLFVSDTEAASLMGSVETVLVNNVDVVFRFPWLAEAFGKVKNRVVLAPLPNDTTESANIVVPTLTWLEDWGDLLVRSPDGDWYGLTQPAVRKQNAAAQSTLGFFLALAKEGGVALDNEELRPRFYMRRDIESAQWDDMLVRGGHWAQEAELYPQLAAYPPPVLPNTGSAPAGYSPFADLEPYAISSLGDVPEQMSLIVLPTHLGDGYLADRPWLQELGDTMTTVLWDSWIEMSEVTARDMGIKRHDRVKVKVNGKELTGSAYPSPFIHPNAVGIPSGRGRKLDPHSEFVKLGWTSEGINPKTLLDGVANASGFVPESASNAELTKGQGSRLLTTMDQRVYNLPRAILPN